MFRVSYALTQLQRVEESTECDECEKMLETVKRKRVHWGERKGEHTSNVDIILKRQERAPMLKRKGNMRLVECLGVYQTQLDIRQCEGLHGGGATAGRDENLVQENKKKQECVICRK